MPVTAESAAVLLALFSRMENRLKNMPRYLAGDEGGRAKADWMRLARDIGEQLAPLIGHRSQEVLTTLPPMREIVRDGRRIFDPMTPPLRGSKRPASLGMRLIEASVRVRNNVFHGGKEDPELERHAGHDQSVVDAAIEVLRKVESLVGRMK